MEVNLRVPIIYHAAQQEVHDHPARFKVMCIGRRGGKTDFGKGEGTVVVANGGKVGYFVPKYKLAEEVWRDYKKIFASAIDAGLADKSEQQRRLDFNGGVLEIWSMEAEDAGLGRSYDLAIMDEAATGEFMRMWNQNILPTLSDRAGKALFLSTPRGFNWFYDIYQRGQDTARWPNWKSWRFPTRVNPYISPDIIEEARLSMPERLFAQEYLAKFLSDATAVFRNVHNCLKATPQEKAIPGHAYAIGGDIARINDFSVYMVIDLSTTPKQVVHIDVSSGVAFEQQMDRLAFLCHRFNPMVVMLEDNANLQFIETTILRGLPIVAFRTTNITKAYAVDKLALAFEQGSLWIPDDEVLKGQLQAYQPTRTPSGLIRYSAPDGMFDDYVSALMIANWAAAEQTIGEAGFISFG